MFEEEQNALVIIVSQNTSPLQRSLDKLTIEIKDKKDRLKSLLKETNDLKLCTETYQNITDGLKDTENSIDKIKERFKRQIEKLKNDNDNTNNKLRHLEEHSRRDNLHFDGIEE